MARYNGPVSRLCRREGMKLYLKGAKCYTKKCPFERRPTPPGQHGIRRRKMSEYGVQLREKQKVRRVYGVLERQFKHYFETAEARPGVTGENLLRLLETRLDNVVFRMGFASSRAQARQLVTHGHFAVNGRATNVPSYRIREGDRLDVRDGSRKGEYFKNVTDSLRGAQRPDWLTVDADKLSGSVTALPARDQMPLELNEQLVVEYYSR
ncbi:30S ribosomal protein S4 [soil metagenome]|jgi:small subunit ribosomal protein S4|nr:30S ribosomal protein S4 [Chloroflexota bacterium]MBA3795968.1 30S ribosomal protein S4 [Chloroflexota bacterium]MBA3958908.1 30S ribosomal protein S4 [Chloroflexota bacterium]MDQ3553309.1 30S ribosomal protein S4 [Chloroflexota bacterium]